MIINERKRDEIIFPLLSFENILIPCRKLAFVYFQVCHMMKIMLINSANNMKGSEGLLCNNV